MQARRKSKGIFRAIRSTANEISVRNTNLDLGDGLSGEQRACVECVLRIINNFIEKLQVSLVMPHIIVASTELIEEDFKEAGLDFNKIQTSKFKETFLSDENVFQLQQFIEAHFRKSNLWNNWLIFLSSENEGLVDNFTSLYNIIRQRLGKSALTDLKRGNKLLKLQQSIAALDTSLTEYDERLKKQKVKNFWKVGFRLALIHKYEEDNSNNINNMRIKLEIVRSSKAIKKLQHSNYSRFAALENEAGEKRMIYNKLLKEDLMLEKESQAEKKRLLFLLQTYIRKYDQNVGDKIKDNLSLQEDYLAKKSKYDEFMLEYRSKEKEYMAIVEQKEKEEQLLFEQKLMVFMMGRAARAIQVRWRRFRRDQKKKSKKKGKGKKK